MSDERVVVRSVAWREVLPWLLLVRVFRPALSGQALLLATLGALLAPLGWWLAAWAFIDTDQLDANRPLAAIVAANSRLPGARPLAGGLSTASDHPFAGGATGGAARWAFDQPGKWLATFGELTAPWYRLFDTRLSLAQFAYFFAGGLWSLAVWSLVGGALVRLAAVRLTVGERLPLARAARHGLGKFTHYFTAPLYPLLPVAGMGLLLAVFGFVVWLLGGVGSLLGALLWPLALVGGLVMAAALLGLLFGWPLMWAAIGVEDSDAFDALGRSFSYVYQRPLHYLFYALVATLLGALGWLLVANFTEGALHLARWGAVWGLGGERLTELQLLAAGASTTDQSALHAAGRVFGFWEGLARSIGYAFRYSFFWCAATAIYLLLRYDSDQTELDEIELDEELDEPLPPLSTDAHGVPQPPGFTDDVAADLPPSSEE